MIKSQKQIAREISNWINNLSRRLYDLWTKNRWPHGPQEQFLHVLQGFQIVIKTGSLDMFPYGKMEKNNFIFFTCSCCKNSIAAIGLYSVKLNQGNLRWFSQEMSAWTLAAK